MFQKSFSPHIRLKMIRALCLALLAVISLGQASPVAQALKPVDVAPLGPMFKGKLTGSALDRPKRGASASGLTDSEKANIVSRHNGYRGDVSPSASNMVPLRWNDELAQMAQSWADQCTFSHNSAGDRETDDWWWVGQNLAYGYGYSMNDYMDLWNDEKADYDFNSNSCTPGAVCGHYTQAVWADSTDIGCGWATCPYRIGFKTYPFDYLVCNYGPGGNFNGYPPYTSGSSCSNCPSGYGGGCDASNLCKAN